MRLLSSLPCPLLYAHSASSFSSLTVTCQPGYKYDGDFKRSNGGKGRCVARSSSSTKERRSSPAAVVAESAELEKREPAPEPAAAVGGSV